MHANTQMMACKVSWEHTSHLAASHQRDVAVVAQTVTRCQPPEGCTSLSKFNVGCKKLTFIYNNCWVHPALQILCLCYIYIDDSQEYATLHAVSIINYMSTDQVNVTDLAEIAGLPSHRLPRRWVMRFKGISQIVLLGVSLSIQLKEWIRNSCSCHVKTIRLYLGSMVMHYVKTKVKAQLDVHSNKGSTSLRFCCRRRKI